MPPRNERQIEQKKIEHPKFHLFLHSFILVEFFFTVGVFTNPWFCIHSEIERPQILQCCVRRNFATRNLIFNLGHCILNFSLHLPCNQILTIVPSEFFTIDCQFYYRNLYHLELQYLFGFFAIRLTAIGSTTTDCPGAPSVVPVILEIVYRHFKKRLCVV